MKKEVEELNSESERRMVGAREHLQKALETLKKSPGKEKEVEIKALEEELRHVERNEALFRERHRVAENAAEQREKLQHAMMKADKDVHETEEEMKNKRN